jgi:hypothetical protein
VSGSWAVQYLAKSAKECGAISDDHADKRGHALVVSSPELQTVDLGPSKADGL